MEKEIDNSKNCAYTKKEMFSIVQKTQSIFKPYKRNEIVNNRYKKENDKYEGLTNKCIIFSVRIKFNFF